MVILRKKQPMGRYEIILNKEGDKKNPEYLVKNLKVKQQWCPLNKK